MYTSDALALCFCCSVTSWLCLRRGKEGGRARGVSWRSDAKGEWCGAARPRPGAAPGRRGRARGRPRPRRRLRPKAVHPGEGADHVVLVDDLARAARARAVEWADRAGSLRAHDGRRARDGRRCSPRRALPRRGRLWGRLGGRALWEGRAGRRGGSGRAARLGRAVHAGGGTFGARRRGGEGVFGGAADLYHNPTLFCCC